MAKRVVDIEPPKAVVANTMVANKRASDGHKDKDAGAPICAYMAKRRAGGANDRGEEVGA